MDQLKKPDLGRFKRFWQAFEPWLPWISLLWGIASAFLMARGYQNTTRLILYFVALLVCSQFIHKFVGRRILHRVGVLSTQLAIQYIFLFLLPFLFFSKAWLSLGFTIALCVILFWDPWWERFAKHKWFVLIQSGWGAFLTLLFLYGVLFPNATFVYHSFVAMVLLFIGILITKFYKNIMGVRVLGVLAFFGSLAILQWTLPLRFRFPALGIWTRNAHFGFGASEHAEKYFIGSKISIKEFNDFLGSQAEPLCCFSPVVAPPKFQRKIKHQWLVDGNLVDTIELPHVKGSADESRGYRTYSCKQNFGDLNQVSKIECRIFIEDQVYLSTVVLDLIH